MPIPGTSGAGGAGITGAGRKKAIKPNIAKGIVASTAINTKTTRKSLIRIFKIELNGFKFNGVILLKIITCMEIVTLIFETQI